MVCIGRDPVLAPDATCFAVFALSRFNSVPRVMWWGVVTIFTVGYGEMVPTTPGGKWMAAAVILSGIFALALPISIVGASFTVVYEEDLTRRTLERRVRQQQRAVERKELQASSFQRSRTTKGAGIGIIDE
jgi:voltage-gated potassium channel Kch